MRPLRMSHRSFLIYPLLLASKQTTFTSNHQIISYLLRRAMQVTNRALTHAPCELLQTTNKGYFFNLR